MELFLGDILSADVILRLQSPEDETLTLHVHAHVLRRSSEFFDARLSERWDLEDSRPLQLVLPECRNIDSYKRCIELMYSPDKVKHSFFASVLDALEILEVAAELLFHECVSACMCFLEAVPWTSEDEIAIRTSSSTLHLQVTSDLAARLCTFGSIPGCKPIEIMKDVLGDLLSIVSNGISPKARDITKRVLQTNAEFPAFAAVNEMALLKELHNNLDLLKVHLRKFANSLSWNAHLVNIASSALCWVIHELFVLNIADVAVKTFAEEKELAQVMISRPYRNPFTDTLFSILVLMLQALQSGEVIISRSVRLSLVKTWLPAVAELVNDSDDVVKLKESHYDLEKGLCTIIGTLPLVDQLEIFQTWIGTCLKGRKGWPDLSAAFDFWCDKLRQAQQQEGKEGDFLVDDTASVARAITNVELSSSKPTSASSGS